jgi:G:T/U-mismatch repair DNA glycosylase
MTPNKIFKAASNTCAANNRRESQTKRLEQLRAKRLTDVASRVEQATAQAFGRLLVTAIEGNLKRGSMQGKVSTVISLTSSISGHMTFLTDNNTVQVKGRNFAVALLRKKGFNVWLTNSDLVINVRADPPAGASLLATR